VFADLQADTLTVWKGDGRDVANSRELQSAEIPVSVLWHDVVISPGSLSENQLPTRQARTRKWPVVDAFGTPEIDLNASNSRLAAWWNQYSRSVGKSSSACRELACWQKR